MPTWTEQEIRDAYQRCVQTRSRCDAGELPWSALAEHFTEDVVFIDPAWGRVEGITALTEFLEESMQGLDDWDFPEAWTMVEGNRVVTMWWQLMGERDDGTRDSIPGISVLYYAGDGKFCYEMDLLNMAHVLEVMKNGSWVAGPDLNMPPAEPDRDVSLPAGREYLAAG